MCKILSNLGSVDFAVVDNLLQLPVETWCLAVCYNGEFKDKNYTSTKRVFISFSDSSYIGDILSRHCSWGFALISFGNLVPYKAAKKRAFKESSVKSELLVEYILEKEYRWAKLVELINLELGQDA